MPLYPYRAALTFDVEARQFVPNAIGQIFALDDAAFTTPLQPVDASGLPVVLRSSSDFILPTFYVEHPSVNWKSGDFVFPLVTAQPIEGPQGPPGDDGASILPTDSAVAQEISRTDSATRAALDTNFLNKTASSGTGRTLLAAADQPAARSAIGLGAVNNTSDADKPVSSAVETRLRKNLATKWQKPLDRWGAALMGIGSAPVVWLTRGSSTSAGGTVARTDQSWFPRICKMMGQTAGQAEYASVTPATIPATGFYGIKASVGGTQSSNYVSADDITKDISLKPTLVSVMVGSNDWSSNVAPATYKTNVRNYVVSLRSGSPTTTILLIHQQGRWDGDVRAYPWAAYGEALREIAEEFPDVCVFLNLDETFKFLGIPSTDLWEVVVGDNTHLGPAGNKILADEISEFLGLPTTRMLGPEVYSTDTFTAGALTSASTAPIASITIPPKPYIRDLVVTGHVYGSVSAGTGDVVLSAESGLSSSPNRATRISSTTVSSHPVTGRFIIDPYATGAIRLVPSVAGATTMTVSSNAAFMSFTATATPGFA